MTGEPRALHIDQEARISRFVGPREGDQVSGLHATTSNYQPDAWHVELNLILDFRVMKANVFVPH